MNNSKLSEMIQRAFPDLTPAQGAMALVVGGCAFMGLMAILFFAAQGAILLAGGLAIFAVLVFSALAFYALIGEEKKNRGPAQNVNVNVLNVLPNGQSRGEGQAYVQRPQALPDSQPSRAQQHALPAPEDDADMAALRELAQEYRRHQAWQEVPRPRLGNEPRQITSGQRRQLPGGNK